MITFRPTQTWILLGTGDIYIVNVQHEDGREFVCLVQTERGPITPLDVTEESALVREGELLPDNCVIIETTQLLSLDTLIRNLTILRDELAYKWRDTSDEKRQRAQEGEK